MTHDEAITVLRRLCNLRDARAACEMGIHALEREKNDLSRYDQPQLRACESDPRGDDRSSLRQKDPMRVASYIRSHGYKEEADLIEALWREINIDDQLIAMYRSVLQAVPECPAHGECVPHAIKWIEERKEIETGNQASSSEIGSVPSAAK